MTDINLVGTIAAQIADDFAQSTWYNSAGLMAVIGAFLGAAIAGLFNLYSDYKKNIESKKEQRRQAYAKLMSNKHKLAQLFESFYETIARIVAYEDFFLASSKERLDQPLDVDNIRLRNEINVKEQIYSFPILPYPIHVGEPSQNTEYNSLKQRMSDIQKLIGDAEAELSETIALIITLKIPGLKPDDQAIKEIEKIDSSFNEFRKDKFDKHEPTQLSELKGWQLEIQGALLAEIEKVINTPIDAISMPLKNEIMKD